MQGPLTGKNPVPEKKAKQFRYMREKFDAAMWTRLESELVKPARVKEWADAGRTGVTRIEAR